MEEQYQMLQAYNNELLLKQSLLKEELAQKRTKLEEITEERGNSIAVISRLEDKKKVLNEEIGSIDKEHNELFTGCGKIRAEIEQLASTRDNMEQQYNDLSLASERMRGEISLLETSRNNAQEQYDTIIAINSQIKTAIANRDQAQNTYSSMINHNDSTNSQVYSLTHERDNIQNHYINPYTNALQEARNAVGTINAGNYYYNVTIETKHTVRGLFGIKLDPKYTYHTESRFNQDGYNQAVGAANARISSAENQLNVQKANYLGTIDTLNTEISSKQSSLYSSVQIQEALQALNTAKHAVALRGITLETSEQQLASALQILNNASSALQSRQEDLSNHEQKKVEVAESVTMTSTMIKASESDLRNQEQKAEEASSNFKENQTIFALLEKEIGDHKQVLENLDSSFKYTKEELIALEELCRTGEVGIIASGEKVEVARLESEKLEAEKLKLERLEVERIKTEQLGIWKLEGENDGVDGLLGFGALDVQANVEVLGHNSHHNELDINYSDQI